jgi:hypothetical protein
MKKTNKKNLTSERKFKSYFQLTELLTKDDNHHPASIRFSALDVYKDLKTLKKNKTCKFYSTCNEIIAVHKPKNEEMKVYYFPIVEGQNISFLWKK